MVFVARHSVADILNATPDPEADWRNSYKVPLHDPDYSRRLLGQGAAWLNSDVMGHKAAMLQETFLPSAKAHVLNLCCGPGLYEPELRKQGHTHHGMDISPVSFGEDGPGATGGEPGRFALGDLATAHFGGPHDMAVMLYGVFNLFSEADCIRILEKAHAALRSGGHIALELYTFDAVRDMGNLQATWFRARKGLFSDHPHLCLVEHHWKGDEHTTIQFFHIIDAGSGEACIYQMTSLAWPEEEILALLGSVGFVETAAHSGWPDTTGRFTLISGKRR